MKNTPAVSPRVTSRAFWAVKITVLAALAGSAAASSAQAASATWGGATGSNLWSNNANWTPASAPGSVGSTNNPDTATFATTFAASSAVTVDTGRNLQNILINNTGTANTIALTFSGANLVMTGGGSIAFNSATAGTTTFADGISLAGPTFAITDNNTSGAVTFSGGVTNVSGGATVLTLGGTYGTYIFPTGSPTGVVNTGSAAYVSGAITDSGAGAALSLVKSGSGVWLLSNNNTYNGSTTIDGGILEVNNLAVGGSNSSIGKSSNAASNLVFNGGTLAYSGNANVSSGAGTAVAAQLTTDRSLTIGDGSSATNTATIDASNLANYGYNTIGGTLNFSSTAAIAYGTANPGAHLLTLSGQNIGSNTFNLSIADQAGGGATSLTKSGPGTWILGGTNTYTGATTIAGGTLRDGTTNGSALSTNSNLIETNGVFESAAGGFSRTIGTAGGQFQITGGLSGLSAFGSNASYTLTPASGSALQWGSATFKPSVLVLNGYAANKNLTLNDNIDLNGAGRTIANFATGTTSTINGTISNAGSSPAALGKAGTGTLLLNQANTYDGGTFVGGGVLEAGAAGSLGTGNATVASGAELRLDNAGALASGKSVTLNNGILGETFNASQSQLALTSASSGAIAIDGGSNQSNALNLSTLGNGQLYLGSVNGGTYSASSLTVAGGKQNIAGTSTTTGGTYLLGAGGGTLTITGTNVLTDQAPVLLLPNPTNQQQVTFSNTGANGTQQASTSNTSNSVTIGNGQAGQSLTGGTVDLQASQNYTGTTTINQGGNLVVDYSTGTSGNIISSSSPVVLKGGSLGIIGSASGNAIQTYGSVNVNQGSSTINDSTAASAVNLGNLTVSNSSSLLINNTGVTQFSQTNSALVGADTTSTSMHSLGSGALVYHNGSGYFWAGTNSTSSPYSVTALTGETTAIPTTGGSATTDYLYNVAGNTTNTATTSTAMNLLRFTNTNSANASFVIGTTANTNQLTINGVLDSATGGSQTISGAATNSITSSTGNLYLYNYGTGTLAINAKLTGNMNVILGGTGTITDGFTNSDFNGNLILNGATLSSGSGFLGGSAGSTNIKLFVINSGALTLQNTSGTGGQLITPMQWNGNFSLLRASSGGAVNGSGGVSQGFTGTTTLTNNITVTVNTGAQGTWYDNGVIQDGGYGYSLTLGANSNPLTSGTGLLTNTAFSLGGANTFTGNVNILGDGIAFGANATNRNNLVLMAANTSATFAANNLAGLQDSATGSSTETVSGTSLTLWGSGNYSFGGTISGATAVNMSGAGGVQTITGNNTNTGAITVNAGTLLIDNSQGGAFTAGTNALTFGGGTLDIKGAKGAATVQSFGAVTLNAGGSTLLVDNSNGGGTTVNVTTITGTATVGATLDIVAKGATAPTFTTTSTNLNVNGVIGQGSTVYTDNSGNTTWATAATTGGSPFAISSYGGDTTTLATTVGSTTINYSLTGSQTQSAATSVALLRISNTSGTGTLDLATKSLGAAQSGILWNGTSNYSIVNGTLQGNKVGTTKQLVIQNYGTTASTALTIGAVIADNQVGQALVIAGPGTTVLTASNTYTGATYLNGPGIVNFNGNGNFGTSTSLNFTGATLQYASGTTSDLSISGHAMVLNAGGGTLDTNGNGEAFSTVGSYGSGAGSLNVVDSAGGGSLTIAGKTGYTGNTVVKNGGDLILGSTGDLTAGNSTIVANGGTLQGGSTAPASKTAFGTSKAGMVVLQTGGTIAPGAGHGIQNVQGVDIQTANVGAGNGTLNVLTATTLTFNAGSTIKFELDSSLSTSNGAGTAWNPSASTQINLGGGALVKGNAGVGQFVLDFGNTGTYDNGAGMALDPSGNPYADGGSNVYDLINFGATSLTGGLDGNTNFNIDDFSIKNLNGVGVLSFYYNASSNQEELLLTVVPEPSTWAMLIGGLATLIFWTRKRAARRPAMIRK